MLARARAICDRAGTRRARHRTLIAKIRQILSRRDFARSHLTPRETPSHVAATERCAPTTAVAPKPRPEKENHMNANAKAVAASWTKLRS